MSAPNTPTQKVRVSTPAGLSAVIEVVPGDTILEAKLKGFAVIFGQRCTAEQMYAWEDKNGELSWERA